MDLGLEGKTAIVTGGANGIGEAIARELSEEGCEVLVADIDESAGKHLVKELGHPIISTTAPSADAPRSGGQDPSLIHDALGSQIDVVIDGGPVPGGPSSVVSLIDDTPVVIREGLGNVDIFR